MLKRKLWQGWNRMNYEDWSEQEEEMMKLQD